MPEDDESKQHWDSNAQQDETGQAQTQTHSQMPAMKADMLHVTCPVALVPCRLQHTIPRSSRIKAEHSRWHCASETHKVAWTTCLQVLWIGCVFGCWSINLIA